MKNETEKNRRRIKEIKTTKHYIFYTKKKIDKNN